MAGRHGASRRARRRHVRRKARVRRFTASSSAAFLAVAGLGAVDKLALPYGPEGRDVITTNEFAALTADPAQDTADRASALSRASDRPAAAPPSVAVALDVARGKPEPRDPLPADSGSGRRVVFDITAQQVWLVTDDGTVERTYMVSGSRYDQLETGTYEVFSASRNAISWTGSETMEYMVRFARGRNANIGFHDIPVKTATGDEVQTLEELGTPLSDGCIRQDHDDAKALYDFAPVGTTVVVVRS